MKTIFSISKNPIFSLGRVAYSVRESLRRLGKPLDFVETVDADVAIDCPTYRGKASHLITFWETTKLRESDAAWFKSQKKLNVIVTCAQTQKAFADAGIKTQKIILAAEHKPLPLPPFTPFTFYTIYQDAGFWERKRAQDIVDAFELAFRRIPDVKLIMKQGTDCMPLVTFDKRIEIVRDYLHNVSHIHEQGHVFVSACGAEGWGYPHHDAIAHGRPVICQKIGGPLEFLDGTCAWFLSSKMIKAPRKFYEESGQIGKVSIKELAHAMRHAYDNKQEVLEKSVGAFVRARSFTMNQMTISVKEAFSL